MSRNRNLNIIGILSLVIGISAIFASITKPEIRELIGLEKKKTDDDVEEELILFGDEAQIAFDNELKKNECICRNAQLRKSVADVRFYWKGEATPSENDYAKTIRFFFNDLGNGNFNYSGNIISFRPKQGTFVGPKRQIFFSRYNPIKKSGLLSFYENSIYEFIIKDNGRKIELYSAEGTLKTTLICHKEVR